MGTTGATGGTAGGIRHPAAWWAAGCLELRWAGPKRIERTIDGPTMGLDLVRVWQVVSGEAVVELGGRTWRAGPGAWLVLPGAIARQRLAAGTRLRSLACSWRDADGRLPLAGLPPWEVPARQHCRLDRAVTAIEVWMAEHGAGWPDATSTRTQNRAPIGAEAYGGLQLALFRLLAVLVDDLVAPAAADSAVERALALLRTHAAAAYPGTSGVAAAAGLGVRRLEQRFSAALGTTPRAWHQQLRLDEACRRLTTPHPEVKAIARQLGFAGPVVFRRWFRAATGSAPLAWRRLDHGC
jgi:AraC-like DNA-binding protein